MCACVDLGSIPLLVCVPFLCVVDMTTMTLNLERAGFEVCYRCSYPRGISTALYKRIKKGVEIAINVNEMDWCECSDTSDDSDKENWVIDDYSTDEDSDATIPLECSEDDEFINELPTHTPMSELSL